MSVVLTALDGAVTLFAGACIVGQVRAPLTALERVLLSAIAGVITVSAATYGLAFLGGLTAATVFAGPLFVSLAALIVARLTSGDWPLRAWRDAWTETRVLWSERPPYVATLVTVAGVVAVAITYAHAMYMSGGALAAGYETVWADWSQHLTTEASFAVAGNIPPTNPLFSGSPLLYPFLGDFHSATLMALGLSPQASLALPSAVLLVIIGLAIVALARRLGLGGGAGLIAVVICILGGGFGFIGVFADACHAHGFSGAQCTLQHVISDPGDGIKVIAGTLHDIPGVVAAQPRDYDGDLTPAAAQPLPNMQWYTPLFAWWLPQRTLLYGFATVLAILVLVLAAHPRERGSRSAFIVAGLLLGILPLVHVQSLLVAMLLVAGLAVLRRGREWFALGIVAAPLMAPRLVQIALSPHGSAAAGNQYPFLEPGWLANATALGSVQPSGPGAVATWIAQLWSGRWWSFWVLNLGAAVPLCALLLIALAVRLMPSRDAGWRHRIREAARRATDFVSPELRNLALITIVLFAGCNLVVLQSWDWDNTKFFVYWYLVVALLVGALVTHRWRRRWVRGILALVPVSMVLTGFIVLLRLLPWTPAADSVGGPYVVASADERSLAATVAQRTPQHAVFLTLGRPNDPVLTLAGRAGLMGYEGWLWSYGTSFGSRPADVTAMFAGCSGTTPCGVRGLLREYGVDYAELDDRGTDPGAITNTINLTWWAQQGFPVVARSAHITVYDVRGA